MSWKYKRIKLGQQRTEKNSDQIWNARGEFDHYFNANYE